MRPSQSRTISIRGLHYHVRIWGAENAPKLFMMHGWMDVGASFQFLVDALQRDWQVVAPDWRGFGLSEWSAASYWFADYIAALDALVDHFTLDEPARQGRISRRALGEGAARRQRAPQFGSAAQAAVPDGLPDGRSAGDLEAHYRARIVGGGDGIVRSEMARRASRGRGRDRHPCDHPSAAGAGTARRARYNRRGGAHAAPRPARRGRGGDRAFSRRVTHHLFGIASKRASYGALIV